MLIAGCTNLTDNNLVVDNKTVVNNTSNFTSVADSTPAVRLTDYTFYVSIPANTPVNDSVSITFFSDVDWQLWKPMTRVNESVWVFSMPAGWLPDKATRITYGYTRGGDVSKAELIDFDNSSFWLNRSFASDRKYGFVALDVVKSWRDIVTLSSDIIIKGVIHAIVPLNTDSVVLTSNGNNYTLSKFDDFYFGINLSLNYNSSFTLTAYYSNGSVINSNDFLFDREVFAFVSEPGVGRDLIKGHSFSACHYYFRNWLANFPKLQTETCECGLFVIWKGGTTER